MSYRAVTCNAMKPASATKNKSIIVNAAKRADILLVQEGNDPPITAAIKGLGSGWDMFFPTGPSNEDPIAWRKSVFRTFGPSGCRTIMVNKPGVADGPSRGCAWVLLEEIATGQRVIHVNTHLIHQAFTSHKERKPSWTLSLKNLGVVVKTLADRYPGVPVIINADWNNPGRIDIPGISEIDVSSPATFGSNRYDRFLRLGSVSVTNVDDFVVGSDHDSLYGLVTLKGAVTATPKPPAKPAPKPTPKPAPKPPAPVVEDLDWDQEVSLWFPGDKTADDTMRAGQQLNQARGYAHSAYNSAVAVEQTVAAIAKALGPTVEAAVKQSMADSLVDVEVSITSGSASPEDA